jgi:hypothetical protein
MECPGSRIGLLAVAEGCKGHPCVIQSRSIRQSGQPIFPIHCRSADCGWLEKLAGKRIGPLSKDKVWA